MLGTALAYIMETFFMARISLAAAIAAGEACLSGGAAGCCAAAGRAAKTSPSATAAAGKILKTLFISDSPWDFSGSIMIRLESDHDLISLFEHDLFGKAGPP